LSGSNPVSITKKKVSRMRRSLALLPLLLSLAAPVFAGCTFDLLPGVPYPAGVSPAALVLAHFNGDAYLDVAVNPNGTDKILILPGTGAGGFGAPSEVVTGRPILRDVATGDFNKDGKADLVTTNGWLDNFAVQPAVNILLGNGNGTFQPPIHYDVFQNPSHLIVDDFNNDGKADIAAAKNSAFVLLLGLGDGNVVQKSDNVLLPDNNISHPPEAMTHGDFDGDGNLDIAISELLEYKIHVFYGTGDGSFVRGPAIQTNPAYRTLALTAGDYDRDGDSDLAYGENDPYGTATPKQLHILFSMGEERAFHINPDFVFGAMTGSAAMYAQTSDIDQDGDEDIILENSPGFEVFLNDGGAQFYSTIPVENGGLRVAVADVDRDGGRDIVDTNFSSNGNVRVYLNFCAAAGLTLTASPAPSNVDTNVTFTGTVVPPPAVAPTGTLTLKNGKTTLASGDLATSLSVSATLNTLPLGTHYLTLFYSGDTRFAAAITSIAHVVQLPPFGAPAKLTATAAGAAVTVTWTGSQGVSQYEVWRSGAGSAWSLIGTTPDMAFVDSTASPSTAWIYKARAIPTGGVTPSAFSNVDLASTFSFTDATVTAGTTPIRRNHLTELRNAVAAARVTAGLAAAVWGDANPSIVTASHFVEVRTALAQVRTALGMAAVAYTSAPSAGALVRAAHVMETRTALR
jgi:hypothetical protein